MNYSKIVILASVFFLLGMGWYLLSDDSARNMSESVSVSADSMPNPERPTITTQEDTIEEDSAKEQPAPSPAGEELAPGTALVKTMIISDNFDGEANMSITVKAEEILGYGSATSPIAAQQELTISVGRYLKNNPDSKKLMQKGNIITIAISSERGMSLGESQDSKRWSLVEVKSQ